MKFNKNCTKGSGDMEWTQISSVNSMTLTVSLGSWVICSAHHLTERNIAIMGYIYTDGL